jgi:hypothetical protein
VQQPFPLYAGEYFSRAALEGRLAGSMTALAELYARTGDAAFALQVYEVAIQSGVQEPGVLFAGGVEMLRCFRREEGLDLIARAIRARPALRAGLDNLPLHPDELTRLLD